jgi:hypothetical protein
MVALREGRADAAGSGGVQTESGQSGGKNLFI